MSTQPRQIWIRLLSLVVAASLLLAACTPATPTAAPTTPPAQPTTPPAEQPTSAPVAQPTEAPTAVPTEAGPTPGGSYVMSISEEPTTLDSTLNYAAGGDMILAYIGAALIAKDKDNNYVPWIAEKWEASADGLTWTFNLRKDVKFQDGTSLTAKDYAYTFNRALDPEVKSPVAGQSLANVTKVEATDDYTLVLTLKEPYYFLLDNLCSPGYLQPLSQTWVEKEGENYGHNPMSVGPYKFKEWLTGDHVTLERNPDYTWAPAYAHQGPGYVEEITFRFIPDPATMVAGLEAGEIDILPGMDPQYNDRIEATGNFNILKVPASHVSYIALNTAKWPFDDVKVRQAFNYATDRQTTLDVMLKGNGTPTNGPLGPAMTGYNAAVDQPGYAFDLEKAKSLMAEAGWKAGADGILAKDGKPLKFELIAFQGDSRLAELMAEQWKALGADVSIVQQEPGVAMANVMKGDYAASIFGYGWPNADVVWMVFHSKQMGILNTDHVVDPDLDKLLDAMRAETDPAKQKAAVDAAQQMIVDKAYMISVYSEVAFYPIAKKIQGVYSSPINPNVYLEDAYIVQ